MDSIDDSPLSLAVIHLADYVDKILQNGQNIFLPVAVGCVLYCLTFGSQGDIALVAVACLASTETVWPLLARNVYLILGAALLAVCGVIALRLATIAAPCLFSADDSVAQWKDSAGSVFIPSRTTHTRFFPQKHSFAYSYLTVGVPIGLRADNVNGILAADPPPSSSRKWWVRFLTSPPYAVRAADYLARGDRDRGGLRGKLDEFLASQAVEPRDYPHAFLVTAPRFLGYSFNPVSFWYLYSPDKVLSAMILEVNNTFDERRPYLVFRDFDQEAKRIKSQNPPTSSTDAAPVSRISASFQKDFHVSPFNSRKGAYSVLAKDPLGPGMATFRGLDVTINLSSSKGHPKLVARLVNQPDAIDVGGMTGLHKVLFLLRWFWIGFATFPRIVKEAAVLFFRRHLHVWYRPEPLPASLGRHASTTERHLEAAFRDYLRYRVESSPEALRIRYVPSGIPTTAADPELFVFSSKTASTASSSVCEAEIRVLTPVFYARFVHYAHDLEGFFNELVESCTVAVDRPDVLPHIFLKAGGPPSPLPSSGISEYVAFKLIQTLRRAPEPICRPKTSADADAPSSQKPVDIRGFRISPMDAYVLEHGDDALKSEYWSAVTREFLADRFFLGSLEILAVVGLVVRTGIAYAFVSALFPV